MKRILLSVFFVILALCSLAVIVSAKEAYLEEIPENLLWENDTVTHFIVFDDEKYYKSSGDTINYLNVENIEASLSDLGISSTDIGKKYLTKFVFPAYMGDTLITYVNVNSDRQHGIKVSKYFKDVCGYVVFPGTVTKTHDMNQCVSQLRGIDFGENSQLTAIPYCFASNAGKLKEVKNFPTAQLDTIGGDAFNGTRQAFRGELIINARVVEVNAFNNATTFVTSLVFGEKVETIQTQAFSVRAAETNLGAPLLERIEFKCDVASLTTTSYGPFYFELGGSSRSEYTSLKCIVLSNEANSSKITEGVTTFRDIVGDSTYMRFFLDTSKEFVYSSHIISMENAEISYDSFLQNGKLTGYCERCGKAEVTSVAPLFSFEGLSVPEDSGRIEIYIGFATNYDAILQYEKISGNTVDFGIIAAAKNVLGSSLPLDENGCAINNNVVKASVHNDNKYAYFELRLNGFTEANKDTELLLASYVHITDKNGATVSVSYLQSSQVENNDFLYVSYNYFQ